MEPRGTQAPHDAGPQGVFLTFVEAVVNWVVTNSQWPVTMGLACCATEMMSFGTPCFDAVRFGMEAFRAPPCQVDLMIVSGWVSRRMTPVVCDIHNRMTDPKWVVSMGVCVSSGGMLNNYAIVQGCDHIVSVDVYLPGCSPRPEMLINTVFGLREHVKRNRRLTKGAREVAARITEKAAFAAPDIHAMKGLLA